MHAAGLAHSDLSYNNVLIDPVTGKATIIDIDGLVVPGKFPPDVIGTPDFIAPEVMATKHLGKTDKNRKLPSIQTDRHALAVMIYMYLLYRHPLRGGKIHDLDPMKDEELGMGAKALFVEHPTDKSNRPKLSDVKANSFPLGRCKQNSIFRYGSLLESTYLTKHLLMAYKIQQKDQQQLNGSKH
jgi:serine/threonine protein kinase